MNTVCQSLTLNACNVNCRRDIRINICFIWIRIKQLRNTRLTCFGIMPALALSRTFPLGCVAYNIAFNEDTGASTYYVISNWYGVITDRWNITWYVYCVRVSWCRCLFGISSYGNCTLRTWHISTYSYSLPTSWTFWHNFTGLKSFVWVFYSSSLQPQPVLCVYGKPFIINIIYSNGIIGDIFHSPVYKNPMWWVNHIFNNMHTNYTTHVTIDVNRIALGVYKIIRWNTTYFNRAVYPYTIRTYIRISSTSYISSNA